MIWKARKNGLASLKIGGQRFIKIVKWNVSTIGILQEDGESSHLHCASIMKPSLIRFKILFG